MHKHIIHRHRHVHLHGLVIRSSWVWSPTWTRDKLSSPELTFISYFQAHSTTVTAVVHKKAPVILPKVLGAGYSQTHTQPLNVNSYFYNTKKNAFLERRHTHTCTHTHTHMYAPTCMPTHTLLHATRSGCDKSQQILWSRIWEIYWLDIHSTSGPTHLFQL